MRYQAALFTEMFNWGLVPVNDAYITDSDRRRKCFLQKNVMS
ncbi:hypothetical protein IFVP177_C110033 [Vibrio parahaemolyticus]